MIHQGDNAPDSPDHGFAQVGYFQGYGQCIYFATEYNRDFNDNILHRAVMTNYGCLSSTSPGSSNQFWVQYYQGVLRLNIDRTVMTTTPWDPYAYWNYSASGPSYGPFIAEFESETKYSGSNTPAAVFSNMKVQNFSDVFTSTLPPLYDSCPRPGRYVHFFDSSNQFEFKTSGNQYARTC